MVLCPLGRGKHDIIFLHSPVCIRGFCESTEGKILRLLLNYYFFLWQHQCAALRCEKHGVILSNLAVVMDGTSCIPGMVSKSLLLSLPSVLS